MYNKRSKSLLVSTLSIKVAFLIVLFAGVPYFLVSVSNKYQKKAEGVLDQESAVVEIQTESTKELKVLTQIEANTLNKITDFIGGTWISEIDGRYRIQISSDNKFEEYYDDTKEGFGVWRVFSGVKEDVDLSNSPEIANESSNHISSISNHTAGSPEETTSNTSSAYTKSQFESTSEKESKYFFQKQQYEPSHKGEKYIYQIQQLDTEKFILVYKGGAGKPLVFVRPIASVKDTLVR